MKEWTKEEKYSTYSTPEELMPIYETVKKSIYRQHFHIQPVTGLLNDPNGFIYHDGIWHLFYQWFPLGAIHGLKHWYHVASRDLVHWENEGLAIRPGDDQDNKGAYSGSAFYYRGTDGGREKEGIYLFYTGNHRDEDWTRHPNTSAARLEINDGSEIPHNVTKLIGPIIEENTAYSEDQRDPKIYYNEKLGRYFIILGARTLDDRGCVIVYQSEDILSGWTFAGELNIPGFENFGKMWECPTLERISGKDVLLFCPQHIELGGREGTTNNCGYIIGEMDWESLTFVPEGSFHVLDFGFDFYAIACAASRDSEDAAMVIAWMGLPDSGYYSDKDEWAGCLTLPRKMLIKNRRLITAPIDMSSIRQEKYLSMKGSEGEELKGRHPSHSEIELEMTGKDAEIRLFSDEDYNGGIVLKFTAETGELLLDRSGLSVKINPQHGSRRSHRLLSPLRSIRIFIDSSSVELFINEGEQSFTSRVFPEEGECHFLIKGARSLDIWKLGMAVEDTFVV